jgi:hypothetical protein
VPKYLQNLAARISERSPAVRPRFVSLFEPPRAVVGLDLVGPRPQSPDEPEQVDTIFAEPRSPLPSTRDFQSPRPSAPTTRSSKDFETSVPWEILAPSPIETSRQNVSDVHRFQRGLTKETLLDRPDTSKARPQITPKIAGTVPRALERENQPVDDDATRAASRAPAVKPISRTPDDQQLSGLVPSNAVNASKPAESRAESNPPTDKFSSLTPSPKPAPDHSRNEDAHLESYATVREEVHVVIGKVTVNAIVPPQPTVRAASPAGPKLSLEQYLKDRERRS